MGSLGHRLILVSNGAEGGREGWREGGIINVTIYFTNILPSQYSEFSYIARHFHIKVKISHSLGFAWVHSGAPRVAGYIRVRLGTFGRAKLSRASFGFVRAHSCASSCRRVHSGSLGFHSGAHRCCRVHSELRGFTGARVWFARLIWFRVG